MVVELRTSTKLVVLLVWSIEAKVDEQPISYLLTSASTERHLITSQWGCVCDLRSSSRVRDLGH